MKLLSWLIFSLVGCCGSVAAQSLPFFSPHGPGKPALDFSNIGNGSWASVANGNLSSNGEYVSYSIGNFPEAGFATIVVQSLDGEWKREIVRRSSASAYFDGRGVFTADSRLVIFKLGRDSLCLITLGSSKERYIGNAADYKLINLNGSEYLLYKCAGQDGALTLQRLGTDSVKIRFPNVAGYLISSDSKTVLLRSGPDEAQKLAIASLTDGKRHQFWEGGQVSNLVLSDDGSQVAFVTGEDESKSVWHYRLGFPTPVKILDSNANGIGQGLQFGSLTRFSKGGDRLFIRLRERGLPRPSDGIAQVDVWSYTDAKLQSQQLFEMEAGPRSSVAVLEIGTGGIIQLGKLGEGGRADRDDNNYYLSSLENLDERHWNKEAGFATFVASVETGKREELGILDPYMSLGGKYITGRAELDLMDLVVYDSEAGSGFKVNSLLNLPRGDQGRDTPQSKDVIGLEVAGWTDNDESVLVYDRYDIWKIDPKGKKSAVNVTDGYGRKHNITFRLMKADLYGDITFQNSGKVILTAFDHKDKNNGFYEADLSKPRQPRELTMGPCVYFDRSTGIGAKVMKAKDADVYLIRKENASQSPNYFWTKDFEYFHQLSSVYPEKRFNWLTTELHTFQSMDNREVKGILYKPENFNPKEKYPVIVHYYEEKSQTLNQYLFPYLSTGDMNIPWFVSHGYLVFVPDIKYVIGEPGLSAYNSIEGAASYLKSLPFVDGKGLGLQGFSFGGYETNYMVTQSNTFAAAVAGAGPCDFVSLNGELSATGSSKAQFNEVHQNRLGNTLWNVPDTYIENSPIFNAHRVTTPVLIAFGDEDKMVNFSQGIEFFTALRRLGKRAWMVVYNSTSHGQFDYVGGPDYTIRMTQFFDHYLKDAPAPVWMTRGIPAEYKGTKTGYEFDTEIRTPGPGLLNKQERQKVDSLMRL